MQGKLFLVLIILFSCRFERSPQKEIKVFEAELFLRLVSTYKAKIVNQEYINFQNPITKPPFTAQSLIEFETIGDNGNARGIFCLVYRIPSAKGEGGRLKMTENPCGEKEEGPALRLGGIKDLYLELSATPKDSIRKGEKIRPFHLALAFEKSKKKYLLEIPLLNLSREEIYLKGSKNLRTTSVSSARFSNGLSSSYAPGVIFFPIIEEKRISHKVEMIGEISDNYPNGSSKYCHKVNEKCQSENEFSCERCRYGWFEVVPTKCPLAGDKFCGVDRCGEKGHPACFRGLKFERGLGFSGCNPENKSAFCQKGLTLVCDTKGVLICD